MSDWEFRNPTFSGLTSKLQLGDVIVLFEDGQYESLPRGSGLISLLDYFSRPEVTAQSAEELESMLDQLPDDILRSSWKNWLESYVPPSNLVKRAIADLAFYEKIQNSNNAEITGRRRSEALSYPMTVLGMVLAVVALGHLISCRPDALDPMFVEDPTVGMLGRVARTVGLIVVLSGFDLFWTILAWQGNQMRELNPLGSHLMEDTSSLILFKATATLLSTGMLLAMYRHRSARIAAWWLCLICTVLAFRWLTFNSMFVS